MQITAWIRRAAGPLLAAAALAGCGGGGGGASGVAPSITTQPVNQTVDSGATASFTVGASGDAPLAFQWQRNGADIAGATSSTFSLARVSATDHGAAFGARVSNPAGSATSNAATLSVVVTVPVPTSTAGLSLVAGSAAGAKGSTDGSGAAARFNDPNGLALDGAGNLYLADTLNHTIRKILPDGAVSTLAGMPATPGNVDSTGASARLNRPTGLATGSDGLVYMIDDYERVPFSLAWHSVRTVSAQGQVSTLSNQFAMRGGGIVVTAPGSVYANGSNGLVQFSAGGTPTNFPQAIGSGLARDAAGNFYFTFNNSVRRMSAAGTVTTLAGDANVAGSADGAGAQARFNFGGTTMPDAFIVADAAGNLYLTDSGNHTVRKITPDGVVSTVAGKAGIPGSVTGPLPGGLDFPKGLALLNQKTLYVVSGQSVLKLSLP